MSAWYWLPVTAYIVGGTVVALGVIWFFTRKHD